MAEPDQAAGGASIKVTAGIMVAVVIAALVVFVSLLFLYLRAKRYWGAIPAIGGPRAPLVSPGAAAGTAVPGRGLEPAAVEALPSAVFRRSKQWRAGPECAVCLSELSEGEEVRLLPGCSHGFHLECIDAWFRSHSTCPLCRGPVRAADPGAEPAEPRAGETGSGDGRPPAESPDSPADVLFWGSSSSGPSPEKPEGAVVTEIPRRAAAEGCPSPISPSALKSPSSSARLKSLGKLLIRGNRGTAASPCSPRAGETEQELSGAGVVTNTS